MAKKQYVRLEAFNAKLKTTTRKTYAIIIPSTIYNMPMYATI